MENISDILGIDEAYLPIIGLESYKGADVALIFLSQIFFFITATYLDEFYS